MGSGFSTQDAFMIATIILASVVGFLIITLIITCCCCFKQQRKLMRNGYGPESGGPRRGRMRASRRPRPVADKNGAQWKINPYDRWVEADHQSSPACPICHSKVGCGCRQVAAPTQNWTQNDSDRINVLPRSNPYPAVSGPSANYAGPSANHDYDRVLQNAQAPGGPGGPYGALVPPKLMSSGISGPRSAPYSTNYAPSSQLGVGNSYNNMDSSTAQFVLESAMDRARF